MENIAIIVILLFGIALLAIFSKKYKFPFPILLVITGVLISLIPGLPIIKLDPQVVLLLFMPPLLYSAAWHTSWHEFRTNIRPISLAAIGLVLFTTVLVAIVAHSFIPYFSWPMAFLLGAIISPPDAVAATSVTQGLGLRPTLLNILEGESLLNDASGLIAYKFALVAVTAGNFVFWSAGLTFLYSSILGVGIGFAVGYLIHLFYKKFVCDDTIAVAISLLTPYAAYLIAEHFETSGVLAVVTAGLFLSYRSSRILSHSARIMTTSIWQIINYFLNSLVFILIGLQLREIRSGLSNYSIYELFLYGTIVSIVVILVRFLWIIPSILLSNKVSEKIFKFNSKLTNSETIVFAWSGMRGVVSMAAAMAIPFTLKSGMSLPDRSLVLYLTFCVILVTLIPLGLTLPWLIKKLKISPYSVDMEEYEIRNSVVSHTISYIEENLSLMNDDLLNNIKSKYEVKYNRLQRTDLPSNYFGNGKLLPNQIFNEFTKVQIELINIERQEIEKMHSTGKNEEILRKMIFELDLEETRLQIEMYQN
ncbi:Na+/H+ antiporter [Rhizosphaericola mali]|uniref:Na+/H+ antiporter n=1 Tax=Rhizosphaericola mali TaxID=2545455 RepID=A0A5P2G695_9BACT|nr:Na+/H+ antiporter [Rhizosphaericola mali]QES89290.1 Na+/H+ antiporter [Rhizosphaericola mali]